MNLGSIAQFQGFKGVRFFPPHETLNDCYCHRCYLSFMVDNCKPQQDQLDDRLMHFLFELGGESDL
jgi:hypothetical protein